jgi:hypothetical protein
MIRAFLVPYGCIFGGLSIAPRKFEERDGVIGPKIIVPNGMLLRPLPTASARRIWSRFPKTLGNLRSRIDHHQPGMLRPLWNLRVEPLPAVEDRYDGCTPSRIASQ